MNDPSSERLLRGLGLLAGVVLFVIGAGGPAGTASALKGTINYFLAGTPWTAPDWISEKGLLPFRGIFFLSGAVVIWGALRPRKSKTVAIEPTLLSGAPTLPIRESAAYVRLEMWIGPKSALSPENRLNEAYAEFHRLADAADRGDSEAAALATIVAPWVQDAARFYYSSSMPYHRLERVVLSRLGRFQSSPAVRRHMPPDDPNEIERGLWELHFKPTSANALKEISFLASGQIGEGRNHNESNWKLDGSLLTIRRADGSLQNEFVYVPASRYFACTNAPGAQGLPNQTIRRR